MARRAHADDDGEDLEIIDVAAGAPAPLRAAPRHDPIADEHEHEHESEERPRRRRRRWLWVVVALVAVVLATTVGFTRRSKPADEVTLATPSTVARAFTGTGDELAPPPGIGATVRGMGAGPFVITGPSGVLLVDPRHTRARRILASTSSDATVIDRNGRHVVVADDDQRYVVDVTGSRATLARTGATVFSGLRSGQLWIASDASVEDAFGSATYRLPPRYDAIAQVRGGFLLSRTEATLPQMRLALAVWNPTSGRAPRQLPGAPTRLVAARYDRVAWLGDDCGTLRCPLHVTDVTTGSDAIVGLPYAPIAVGEPLRRATSGRFSPDGRFLAVLTPNRNGATAGVALVDLTTGASRALYSLYGPSRYVPDDDVIARALPFDWSPDGRSLVAIQPSDNGTAARLTRIDTTTGQPTTSGDALPLATSFVSVGVTPTSDVSPVLPAAQPLLGEPTGIVLIALQGQSVERLDLDTGATTTTEVPPLGGFAHDSGRNGVSTFTPFDETTVVPLAGGAVFVSGAKALWVPRTGAPSLIGDGIVGAIAESRARAWLLRTFSGHTSLTPVDGRTGATGTPIETFDRPAGAVSSGFVENIPATLDRAASIDVWDPTTREHHSAVPTFGAPPNVIAAAGDHILWSTDCESPADPTPCGVRDTNVATGETKSYGDWSARSFTIAPDGHAAVFIPTSGDGAGWPQYVDLTSGTRQALPDANGVGRTVWGPNGWLFYSTDDGNGLAAWRPGLRAPRMLAGITSVLSASAAI